MCLPKDKGCFTSVFSWIHGSVNALYGILSWTQYRLPTGLDFLAKCSNDLYFTFTC